TNQVFKLILWTPSELFITNCSILGFAFPGQLVQLHTQLNGLQGGLSGRVLDLLSQNGTILLSISTSHQGLGIFNLQAPIAEGQYTLEIRYNGSLAHFELPATHQFRFIVTRKMPLLVELDYYEILAPLQEIRVVLRLIALNGTILEDVKILCTWLARNTSTISQSGGIAVFHLTIPSTEGTYPLYYETHSSECLQTTTGYVLIFVSTYESMAAQGIGIPAIIISLGTSIGVATFPNLYRRRLIG
ncbi:MAG: hypothetical protein ACFE7R_00335, partial [Candidatus Hodarchaeota archaeon]